MFADILSLFTLIFLDYSVLRWCARNNFLTSECLDESLGAFTIFFERDEITASIFSYLLSPSLILLISLNVTITLLETIEGHIEPLLVEFVGGICDASCRESLRIKFMLIIILLANNSRHLGLELGLNTMHLISSFSIVGLLLLLN